MKECLSCGAPAYTTKSRDWGNYCKACLNFKTRYGFRLTHEDRAMLDANEECQICAETEGLHIDHDHKTNKIRGYLCSNCNHGIGKFYDSTELLQNAINYLNKYEITS